MSSRHSTQADDYSQGGFSVQGAGNQDENDEEAVEDSSDGSESILEDSAEEGSSDEE